MKNNKLKTMALLSMLVVLSTAADLSPAWHTGTITLRNGEMVSGQFYYDLNQNLLWFVDGQDIQNYPAELVNSFEIPGCEPGAGRKYQSMPAGKGSVFFEVLAQGKLTLLHHQVLHKRRSIKSSPLYHVDRFCALKEDGSIAHLNSPKQDVMELMADQGEAVQNYKQMRNLNLNSKSHLREIFEYYNSLN